MDKATYVLFCNSFTLKPSLKGQRRERSSFTSPSNLGRQVRKDSKIDRDREYGHNALSLLSYRYSNTVHVNEICSRVVDEI
jgi:hypothetical protein